MISSEGIHFRLEPWRCPVCKGSEEKTVGLRGGEHQREGKGIVTKVVRCRSCTLLYANPFPVAENLAEVYGDPVSYFATHDCTAKIAANQVLLNRLSEFSPRPYPVLDVGAGLGELLVAARNLHVKAQGLEISEAMAAEARRRHGVEVSLISIERAAELWPGRFGAVILNAVLEHVYDPAAMIAAASTLLREGGVLYLDVPNEPSLPTMLGNLARRLSGSRTIYNLSPTWEPFHVYGFNSRALRILLGKHGFAVRELKVHADSHYPSTGSLSDRAACFAASAAARLANLTGTASNLSLWAVKFSN
jgi:SAM-dependent methyltransferase